MGGLGLGLSREVICLSGLVGSEDVGGMFQVLLRQPEVVLWPVSFEPNEVLWLLVRADQSVCDDVLHFKLFLVIHQLQRGGLVRWPDLWRAVVI